MEGGRGEEVEEEEERKDARASDLNRTDVNDLQRKQGAELLIACCIVQLQQCTFLIKQLHTSNKMHEAGIIHIDGC